VFLLVNLTQATIIHVPAEQPTIQAGINASVNGDTVLVAPGTYQGLFDINSKSIVLASEFLFTGDTGTISSTVISAPDSPNHLTVITLENVPDTNCVISGFTITNGSVGIMCYRSSPLICYNHILENGSYAENSGGIVIGSITSLYLPRVLFNTISNNWGSPAGGISYVTNLIANYSSGILVEKGQSGAITSISNDWNLMSGRISKSSDDTPPFIKGNIISSNRGEKGGGIGLIGGWAYSIEDNLITGNIAPNGAAVFCSSSSSNAWVISNNTISHNAGTYAGGIYCSLGSDMEIKNNIVCNSTDGFGIYYGMSPKEPNPLLLISYNDVWGNADGEYGGSCPDQTGFNGNISADPLFCNLQNGNYLLNNTSPCVGAGEGGINIGAFGVGCGMNYGVHVYNGEDTSGFVNSQVKVTFFVQNTGQLSDTYNLVISDSLGWQVNPTYSQMTLNSGQQDSILVTVSIPSTSIYTKNKVRLTATSQTEPLATDSGWLMISVIPVLGDANCDGVVDVGDVIYTINYLFKGGPQPCEP
jgi:hypothetical protein